MAKDGALEAKAGDLPLLSLPCSSLFEVLEGKE